MRTACELPFLKSLVLAMANPFWMYMYVLIQEEMNVKPSIKSICGASYIDVSNRCIDISKDEPETKCLIYLPIKIFGGL